MAASASASRTVDPPSTGRFVFTVDGVEIGAFTEVSGLSVEVEVEELPEGGQNQFVHQLPGRTKWPRLVLKRGVTDSDGLFDWFAKTSGEGFSGAGDQLARLDGEVVLMDVVGAPVRRWAFSGAFPVKWSGPTLAASSSDVAIEELEIAHHGFRPSA
jgi:phage tail-like protein